MCLDHLFSCQNYSNIGSKYVGPNTINQVAMCRDWAHYWMFHCFWTPSCVLLGANAKSRSLRKLSLPHGSTGKRKWCFYLHKLCVAQPYFFILPPRGPTMPPIVAKTGKITVIHHVITLIIHPGHNRWPEMGIWAHGVHNFVSESQVMEHVYHVVHFGFVLHTYEKWFR